MENGGVIITDFINLKKGKIHKKVIPHSNGVGATSVAL
jgi:hypothetical protein